MTGREKGNLQEHNCGFIALTYAKLKWKIAEVQVKNSFVTKSYYHVIIRKYNSTSTE